LVCLNGSSPLNTILTAPGYDTGYISSVLVTIGTSLGHELTSSEQELVTSLTSGGALVGAVIAGTIADRFGRKMPIFLACIVFVIGTVLQTAAYHLPQFAVGRFVVGLGVGSAAMVVPLYISELSPARFRGRMIAFNNVSIRSKFEGKMLTPGVDVCHFRSTPCLSHRCRICTSWRR
jgi:MFS family permease